MGLWYTLTILLNVLSAGLIVVVFALLKRQNTLKQDIRRLQKEWLEWRALSVTSPTSEGREFSQSDSGTYVSESHVQEPAIDFSQNIRARAVFANDWGHIASTCAGATSGGIREKPAKSLKSETLGTPVDRFSKARELLRQGHGMKEVAVVTGLSYSELVLLSKT